MQRRAGTHLLRLDVGDKPLRPAQPQKRKMNDAKAKQPRQELQDLKQEGDMKPSTKHQAKGKFHEVKGKIKEKVGKATNNPDLEVEGKNERTAGKIQKKIGQVEKVLGD